MPVKIDLRKRWTMLADKLEIAQHHRRLCDEMSAATETLYYKWKDQMSLEIQAQVSEGLISYAEALHIHIENMEVALFNYWDPLPKSKAA